MPGLQVWQVIADRVDNRWLGLYFANVRPAVRDAVRVFPFYEYRMGF